MSNFIFNEGAIAALSADIDWLGGGWSLAVYETPLIADETMSWADVSAFVVATEPMNNPVITSYGAASSDNVTFTSISPTDPQTLFGMFIVRDSDNLLLTHLDSGFEGSNPVPDTRAGFPGVLQLQALAIEYTFTVRPGDNNERAWFRL